MAEPSLSPARPITRLPLNALAPIAIFAYRRLAQLQNTLFQLQRCPEFPDSRVFVFSDAAKSNADFPDVAAVRSFLRTWAPTNVSIVEAQENLGLANSVINGVSRLCSEFGRAIVIEDDLISSPSLLRWFNSALDRYEDEQRIMQIAGHVFSNPVLHRRSSAYFLPVTTSWGWATWSRAWNQLDPESRGWEELLRDKNLRKSFDLGGVYPFARMMQRQMTGRLDSWAIRWYWSVFSRDGLVLFPPRSFIAHVGYDKRATHKGYLRLLQRVLHPDPTLGELPIPAFPKQIATDDVAYRAFKRGVLVSRLIRRG